MARQSESELAACRAALAQTGDRMRIRARAFVQPRAERLLAPYRSPPRRWPWLAAGFGVGLAASSLLLVPRQGRRALLARRIPADESSHQREVDGIPMRWEERGEGPPVVLVHGIPTSPRLWRFVTPHLTGVRALSWELVGFGHSIPAGRGRDLGLPAQADYLHRWLQAMGIDRAVFVGHDLGGGVVQRFAVAHPEMVAGLALVDSVAFDNWPLPLVKLARAARSRLGSLPASAVRALLWTVLANAGHSTVQGRFEARYLYWKPYAEDRAGEALAHQLEALDADRTLEIGDDLARLAVPARVVWGELDPLPLRSAMRLARALGTDVRVLRGARHYTPEDRPEEVADEINALIAEAYRTSSAGAPGPERGAELWAPSDREPTH